jgi:hypothetical protein
MRLILITSASYYRVSGGGELINASTGFLHRLTTVTFSVHSHGGWRLHKCTHLHACVADPNLLLRYGLDSPVLPFAPTRERERGDAAGTGRGWAAMACACSMARRNARSTCQ